jgi:lactoylglutathione lyase
MKRTFLLIIFLSYTIYIDSQVAISGYNHVGLSVKDINVSTNFYKNIIGLKPIAVPSYMKRIRSWFQIAPGQELHLLAGRKDPVTNNHSNGAHFSFSITDAHKITKYLDESNLKYIKQQRFDGAWQVYVTDPDGYVIELNEPKVNWTSLFNEKDLKNWTVVKKGEGNNIPFSIVNMNDTPSIKAKGSSAILISKKEYSNYHLQLEYKWIESESSSRQSGIFYHIQNKIIDCVPSAHEYNLTSQGSGTYLPHIESQASITTDNNIEGNIAYRKNGKEIMVADNATAKRIAPSINAEYPDGDWHIIDLYCLGETAIHMLNGKTVIVLKNSQRVDEKGNKSSLTKGKIALQSEGSEILFRNIKISSLDSMPENVLNQDNR